MRKEYILVEIRRTAKENGGKPLGKARFERATGINSYDMAKYWARFGDAQREAGFEPNTLQGAYDDEYLLRNLAELTRELHKFPTKGEQRLKSFSTPGFPDRNTFERLGNKSQLISKVFAYCSARTEYKDVVSILEPAIAIAEIDDTNSNINSYEENAGEVYMFKSGRYYKIGMTKDKVRRGSELRIQLPEKMDLIHSIQTDDPSGVEAYWHRRFETKRMNGEWFNLSSADVKAFRRWRRIY